ncbi:MAG: hypothetical protein AB8B85_02770 [Paracoccaceae bacterium]
MNCIHIRLDRVFGTAENISQAQQFDQVMAKLFGIVSFKRVRYSASQACYLYSNDGIQYSAIPAEGLSLFLEDAATPLDQLEQR